ncbi:IclR family transcriptional regulator [Pigmentiphaga aceris]|nr:IclR family transcriptional regulator [Pigmentiphaga aceris]
MDPYERRDRAQTLRRGLSILRLLIRKSPDSLRMSELVQRLDLNKATVIRLTQALVDEGFVSRDPASGRYSLGPETFAAGLAAEHAYDLQRLARPALRKLSLESGDTVFFSVRHAHEAICLSQELGVVELHTQQMKPGDRFPLGVGAGSAAILSALPDAEITTVLKDSCDRRAAHWPAATDVEIWKLVEEARTTGYCFNSGLVTPQSGGLGVALALPNQPLVAISIAAAEKRLSLPRRAILGSRLLEIAAAIKDQVS